MTNRHSVPMHIERVPGGGAEDDVAIEEPLEIRIGETPLSVTLRTPGHDYELALGFLLTEGILRSAADVESVRHWGSPNVVRVALRDGVSVDLQRLKRHFYSTSSCGVCGKTSIDALRVSTSRLESHTLLDASVAHALPERLRDAQDGFATTGSLHGAAACTVTGEVIAVREDIGRHNAVDKAVGALLQSGVGADVMVVSGRIGFEIVQKCVVARIPILLAVGAPSSLAVELAREFNLTLAGFVRDGRFNVYAGLDRISF